MVSVVLDTVVFVRSLLNPQSVWGRVIFDAGDAYRLIVSDSVQEEIVRVIARPELKRKYRFVAGRGQAVVLARLAEADVVAVSDVPAVSRDPKDDKFLAAAKAGRADYLVSEDYDLLVLGKYEGTRIVEAATFLGVLDDPHTPVGRA